MLIQLLIQQPAIAPDIVRGTPTWVWGLLAALLVLGASQMRTRAVDLTRLTLMPVAMSILSLWSIGTAFGRSPHIALAVGTWFAGLVVVLLLAGAWPRRTALAFDARTRAVTVPGSVMPLLLILAIFVLRYGVNVELAMAPQLAGNADYAATVGTIYGLCSGVFAGRAWRLVQSARPSRAIHLA